MSETEDYKRGAARGLGLGGALLASLFSWGCTPSGHEPGLDGLDNESGGVNKNYPVTMADDIQVTCQPEIIIVDSQRKYPRSGDVGEIKAFYDSLSPQKSSHDIYFVTPDEAVYLETFRGMSKGEQRRLLDDSDLKKLGLPNYSNPDIMNVLFLYNSKILYNSKRARGN